MCKMVAPGLRIVPTVVAVLTLSIIHTLTAMAVSKYSKPYHLLFSGYTGTVSRYTFTPPARLAATDEAINGTVGNGPSWISFSAQHSVLYVTDEDTPGRVFALNSDLKTLGSAKQQSNGSSTGGDGPVSSEVVGNMLFIANYLSGSASVHRLDPHTGLLVDDEPAQVFRFEREPRGSIGPISSRQDHSYAHQVSAEPSGRFVYVPDLGADKIHRLAVLQRGHRNSGDVKVVGETSIKAGSGPRHISFYRKGHKVFGYLACELDTTLVAFKVDEHDGSLEQIGEPQLVLPAGRTPGGNSTVGHALTASEVAVSPDGRFVYVGCRGEKQDHVAIFRRDPGTGAVSWSEWVESGGRNLRHFSLSPDPEARYLAAGHQATGNVTIMERDGEKGSLRRVSEVGGMGMVAFAGFIPEHPRHDKDVQLL